ncbi:PAS domain-containing sensor histidine kinase [Sneathiella sp.]|uniref:PAS domain-containing sensor histidine kinase n=1 Tax=Sneathiella sp. TaxID=1964365 RepID=UPI00261BA14C|nr:PAS domain-containing sensor histidine kinase [Sneathiella sp.]MDF2368341.1 ATP-binding protein [Sneathiella sp.]
MLSELAILICLLVMLAVFWRRKKRLTHVKIGRDLINYGLLIVVFASLIDVLFVGDGSAFDIGFSNESSLEVWRVVAYLPGLVLVSVGLMRMLPAIERLNQEIQARIVSEEKQREQNQRLQMAIARAETAENTLLDAIESMPEAVAIYDANDRLYICNNPYRERYKDIIDKVKPGIHFNDLVRHMVDLGRVAEAVGREEDYIAVRIKEHQNPSDPVEQEFDDGRVYRLSETKTKAGGTVSIRTDITDIRVREQTLKENRAKLEEAQAIAHIGSWMHSIDAGKHEWSDEVFRILGYKPGEIEQRYSNFVSRVHKNDLARLRSVFETATENIEPFEAEFRVVHDEGRIIYVRLIGRANISENGTLIGASGTLQDITTQHMFERELIQAKLEAEEGTRSKSLFLANMSHELRTPLNAVIGFSEVLAKEIFGPIENDRYREYADNIQSSGRHLLSLIDDILEYSRLEADSIELQEAEFNLLKVVESTKTMLAAKANEKSISFSMSDRLDIQIRADERKLKQVFINLVNNAIKFTPEKGHIELDLSADSDNFISLYIIDNGYGISEEEIKNVMRPFGRTHYSISKSIEGTGLGLPLAKSIVELHGGMLEISSNTEKPGTVIEIRLPKSRVVGPQQGTPHLNLIARP